MLADVRSLILEGRQQTAQIVNAGLTFLYWKVGNRVRREILQERRAEYGAEIVTTLGKRLEQEFGRGFGAKSLHRMVQFVECSRILRLSPHCRDNWVGATSGRSSR